jgi:UDP-N-acetylglucosamine--dolichyl-phosphate N-acetylglucosaminephosphotransferase
MLQSINLLSVATSLVITWFIILQWIKKAPEVGLMGADMNKPGKPLVAEMGGVPLVFGFVMGLLLYIGMITFLNKSTEFVDIMATLCTILMLAIIGMIDDFFGWKKGLKQWQKPLLTLLAAMPLMVINAGNSTMVLPIVGEVNWGIFYPLFIIPIGIVVASNAFNMIAGYNGLEAGMGIIILSYLGYVAYRTNHRSSTILAFCMTGALIAFIYFNWYPARIFPGDTLTYGVGGLIASVAILGDMQRIAVILFIPYFLDFLLALRKRFKAEAFAKVNSDGSLEIPYDRIYHLVHLALIIIKKFKGVVYEKDVVLSVLSLEIVIVCITWLLYHNLWD